MSTAGTAANDSFRDKVILVTGAAQGIGLATARLFVERGGTVVFADLDRELVAKEAAAVAADTGSAVESAALDLRSRESVDSVVDGVFSTFGKLDVLVNLAAIFPVSPALENSDEMWDDMIRTNLTGTFLINRAAGRIMRDARSGSIVNTASGAALMPNAGLAAYSASKAGVIGFSRVLAFELAPDVRVNVVAPGPTKTPRTTGMVGLDNVPMGRQGSPEELAQVIAFVASDEASFMTGQVVHVNGGKFMT